MIIIISIIVMYTKVSNKHAVYISVSYIVPLRSENCPPALGNLIRSERSPLWVLTPLSPPAAVHAVQRTTKRKCTVHVSMDHSLSRNDAFVGT